LRRPRTSLFAKIFLWFFLSLVVLIGVLWAAADLRFRLIPRLPALGRSQQRVEAVGRLISHELSTVFRGGWNEVLDRYSEAYQLDFILCSNDGGRLAGKDIPIPPTVLARIDASDESRPKHPPGLHPPVPPGHGHFRAKTSKPTRYWIGIRIPLVAEHGRASTPATLLVVSDTSTGGGLFLDPSPWIILVALVILLSAALWIPMVRSITGPLARMTKATRQIERGRFDVKLDEGRSDEIGQLGHAINEMASRLDSYLKGQKRFLGDVAHELASPVARIQLGLGILEDRVKDENRERVQDVIEDAGHMSNLVKELLSFSRAEIDPTKVRLQGVRLVDVARRVLEREQITHEDVQIQVEDNLKAMADPELLVRALSNMFRNAARYAGDAGPITISARQKAGEVMIEVVDSGEGVPEEHLGHLFEPFYRIDASRGRNTGGVGLGLAIVKTCVESCGGLVTASNLKPKGFAVTITLKASK